MQTTLDQVCLSELSNSCAGMQTMVDGENWLEHSPLLTPEAITRTLAALVGINSVNPSFGGPAGGERAVADWAARFLAEYGVTAQFEQALPGRHNLRARIEGQTDGPPLLFETHIDTVSIQGMTIDPFAATIRDGRLWGRGATDAKAQAAAMLHALAAWASAAASGRRPPRPLELVLAIGEEFNFDGARAMLRQGVRAAGIVIGEPTGLRVVTTHKGTIRWWIHVMGKAAHASMPQRGVSAIGSAAALIMEIDNGYSKELAARRAPLLDPPTINIGLIQGGVQVNMVPADCRLYLDRRTIPGETDAAVFAEMKTLFDRVTERRPHFQARQEPPTLIAPPMATDPDNPLARAALSIAAAHGLSDEPAGVDYATDASVLTAAGVPIIIWGPGHIKHAHTADEFVELDQLALAAKMYAEMIGKEW